MREGGREGEGERDLGRNYERLQLNVSSWTCTFLQQQLVHCSIVSHCKQLVGHWMCCHGNERGLLS